MHQALNTRKAAIAIVVRMKNAAETAYR